MGFEYGQMLIDLLRGKKRSFSFSHCANHLKYGKIYYPVYNLDLEFKEGNSNLYNEYGEKLEEFFIRDIYDASRPYRQSRYFIFDRYNFGLKTHFYTHNAMFETMGNPDRKYGLLIESEAIYKSEYKKLYSHKSVAKDFDLIFTHSEKVLDTFDNARFVPLCAGLWNKEIKGDRYMNKTKNISILSSDKLMCDMHKFRYDVAMLCKNNHLADTYGTFDGGDLVDVDTTLNDYRFSICIENEIKPYFFTERITSALAAQTIPIYVGASKIDKFFNPDGIIQISVKDDIEKIFKMCTKEYYEERIPAILDNYERALEYKNPYDIIYDKYLKNQ